MAIEALEDAQKSLDGQFSCGNCYTNVIQACKEALEQPSWQGLSDDEINDIKTKTIMGANGMSVEQLLGLIVSLTEQALRNKNGY